MCSYIELWKERSQDRYGYSHWNHLIPYTYDDVGYRKLSIGALIDWKL